MGWDKIGRFFFSERTLSGFGWSLSDGSSSIVGKKDWLLSVGKTLSGFGFTWKEVEWWKLTVCDEDAYETNCWNIPGEKGMFWWA